LRKEGRKRKPRKWESQPGIPWKGTQNGGVAGSFPTRLYCTTKETTGLPNFESFLHRLQYKDDMAPKLYFRGAKGFLVLSRNHYSTRTYYKLASDTVSFSGWHLVSSPGVTTKSPYHQSSQVQPPLSHSTPLSQIYTRVTGRCLRLPELPGFPVLNLEQAANTQASQGFQRREGHQGAGTQHLTTRSYDMMRTFSRMEMSHFSLMARCTASIDTSFLAIQSISLHDLPSLAYVTTKLCPVLYQSVTSNATISRPSFPSCTPCRKSWVYLIIYLASNHNIM